MKALLRKLLNLFRPRPPATSIRVSDEEAALWENDRRRARFAWRDVQEIVAFKRDLGVYDDVRLAFRVDGGWVEVSEDAEGWSALSDAIGRHFPTVPSDWYEAVVLPPFETCYRALYERT